MFPDSLVAKVPSWGINKVLKIDTLVQGLAHANALGHALIAVQTPHWLLGHLPKKGKPRRAPIQ